jgi:Mg2+ and Co2+ transporter CorA
MNFESMPELKSAWGYPGFWAVAAIIVAVLLLIMRRARVL